jgi:hypothetical protein
MRGDVALPAAHSKAWQSVLKSKAMRIPGPARTAVALVAAYAVALQTILLVFGGPVAGAIDFAGRPICSHLGAGTTSPAPSEHGRDCLAACLTGCIGGAVAVPAPGAALFYAPAPLHTVAAAIEAAPAIRLSATGAHRSRAPPPA